MPRNTRARSTERAGRYSLKPIIWPASAAREFWLRDKKGLKLLGMAETTTFVSGHVTPEDGRVLTCNPLSVDVETSGYVLGDRRFQLRTIQLGDDTRCTIFTDPARSAWFARGALNQACEIVAHAGTADLIPIWRESGASEAELESWFDKLTDTYIMSCLAFPLDMTHGLKPLAAKLLEDPKTAQGDAERAKYFRDNKWLTNTEHDTPVSRSGWANCDYTTPVMQNYASGDVFDAAGLAAYFKPQLPEGLLAVEREFRKITARVSWRGVQLDGKHLQKARSEVQTTLEDERDRLDGLGVELPSSSQQVCRALIAEGHLLPLTPQGNPSATAEVLAGLPQTDLVTSLRAWRKADKLRSSFLDPYYTAVKEGDGRVYPTILTLGASATGRTSCVESTALIEMPRDLAKYPGGVPITEVKAGDYVYTFDMERRLRLRRVKWCAQTGVRETVRITVRNSVGHELQLRLTPEHLVRLYNGDWRAAGGLLHRWGRAQRASNERILTMVRRRIDGGYAQFFPNAAAQGNGQGSGGKSREHRWIVGQLRGKRVSTKTDVHHEDGIKINNEISNLRPLSIPEHRGNRKLAWNTPQPEYKGYVGPTDYRVVSVEPAFLEPVWDMEVEDDHNFIANGICVHNCVGPNLQQVPREGGIRECLRADDGHVIVGADFSSVEVRVAAALSQDRHLIDLIVSGLDLHSLIAARVWGPDFTKENRYGAKRGVFGWLYGASVAKIARTLGITDRQAEAIIEALRGIAPGLVAWSQGIRNRVRNGQLQQWEHPSGRITVLDKHQSHKAVNYCIQSTARELLVGAMFRYEFADPGRTLLPIHDEILAFVPEAEAERLTGVLTRSMTTELLGMPIVCEARTPSRNWG